MLSPVAVENAVKTALATVLAGVPAVTGYDQTATPSASQVSVMVSVEPRDMNAAGKPFTFTATVRMFGVTHATEDASGSVRNGLRGTLASWATSVALSSLNVTGWTCYAKVDYGSEDPVPFGTDFVGAATRVGLVYGPA